jgi:hypothetical protein
MANRVITIRRLLEQIVHTAQEALSVYENAEDLNCCVDDLGALQDVVFAVKKRLFEEIDKENNTIFNASTVGYGPKR